MTALVTRAMDALVAIVFAGLLWVLACVPLVTVVPATAALFAVMAGWNADGPPPVWSTFWAALRRHFRQAMWFTVLLAALGGLLTVDVAYGLRAEGAPLRTAVLVVALVAGLLLAGLLAFLFPVMVSYPAPWRAVVRNAALFAAAYVGTTLLCLVSLAVAASLVTVIPATLPLAMGAAAYTVTMLTRRAFAQFLARQEARSTG